MRLHVVLASLCLLLVWSLPSSAFAQTEGGGAGSSGLCGLLHTGAPRCPQGWTLSGTIGYGATQLHGLHQRGVGNLGLAYVPLPWLALSLELLGRLDAHPADTHGGKHLSATGDPWLRARMGWPVGKGVSLGAQLGLWLPGNAAPSYSPKATTIDAQALLSWLDRASAWTLLGMVGVRIDNSAQRAPALARLREGDRIALDLSDSHALLVGAGVARRLGPVQVFGEFSAQLLLGAKAPARSASPLRVAAGARYFFSHGLSAELSVVPALSRRPSTSPDAPLVPIEPRVSVLAGLRYQRLSKLTATPGGARASAQPTSTSQVGDEPEQRAALRGRLSDASGGAVPDATILLNDEAGQKKTVSQVDGSYAFASLKPGTATLSVSAPGFAPSVWEVDVVAPLTEVPERRLAAAEATGNLRCFVRSFKSEPLKAGVVVRDLRGRRVAGGTTNGEGLLELPLSPGQYRVTIDAKGYQSRRSNVRVSPNEVAVLNIDLRAAP